MAMTAAQWRARIAWHLEQADLLLTTMPPDAVTSSGRASAHSRCADAITHALDTKLLP